ncbi:hypothetical protein BKA59DRAFT_503 [Fusarium tricinctum]|uniref:Uncharacterized protein n=1 Tax=Fusarium tricinctum TaxID=61284 RepID=A0A8K0S5S2_9HYPO|nr:hypothetical protein BKA59DRAFT_503 [Fusarium tricinctum]
MDNQLMTRVPLEPALIRRFYIPLLLLVCLPAMCPFRRVSECPLSEASTSLQPLFQAFVSKIAFLCCTEPGSSTISACTVLQLPDRVQYVFGFNQRNRSQLETVQLGITKILWLFGTRSGQDKKTDDQIRTEALSASLEVSECRVGSYLKALTDSLQHCLLACMRDATGDDNPIRAELLNLFEKLKSCLSNHDATLNVTKLRVNHSALPDLISFLNRLFKSDNLHHIRARLARGDDLGSTTYWSDFTHVAGRLQSYKRAADVIFSVSKVWPRLFLDFQVCMIPSSSETPKILKGKPLTAEDISRKITSNQNSLLRFQEQLQYLSVHNLDTKIAELWHDDPRPIVHAEVLVHSWLENSEGGIRPERFFNRWKFIGSSKPPCKLCSYFFDEHPGDVQVRPSHQNVYFRWRMPDIYEHQGEEARMIRMNVMDRIKTRVGADIARIMSERLSDGRPHDSSAYTTLQQHGDIPGPHDSPYSVEATALLLDSTYISGLPDERIDENDGEILLFRGRSSTNKSLPGRLP